MFDIIISMIILASKSPRREELLRKIISEFNVVPSNYDESKLDHSDPVTFAKKASFEKAKDVSTLHFDDVVIGADTIVVLDNKIFGKPNNISDAKKMLKKLSGKTHQVITGITIFQFGKSVTGHALTEVTFNEIDDKDIDSYLKKHKVLDKAGSYAIQDIGEVFVKEIKGDYDNVVGLPVKMLREMLRLFQ